MEIVKFLKSGNISLNNEEGKIEIENSSNYLPYHKISSQDWGRIYEKFVGQCLEKEGYEVKYNGLESGFLDKGIDIIAKKKDRINFIQCKFSTRSKIGKSKINWILYKASNELYKQYQNSEKRIIFTLIVNSTETSFSKKIPKNFKLNFTHSSKIEYPWLQYFLEHNYIQDKIKLEFREIKMNNNYGNNAYK
ncbi:restriction endonuclease [Muricauda sp. SCSIO 64092]|uniref:restriction endonuclease n=1 Tax=Allomuricauda sp. SCSIO 64092 TaxID=2908842 RepID=UPI001FF3B725|nr:restriction endonuclease [Muricauda sp. SCSIO 64092]UOY06568.1 restriction endonuclease [Muricauda sp. SCSIO 64092]